MTKIDEFKSFVKKNPKLVKYVKTGESSWQKFYEIYDLYGEDNDAWKTYLKNDNSADLLGFLKGINLDNLQEGINNLQRVLGVIGEISIKDKPTTEYKPRPMYKHFED